MVLAARSRHHAQKKTLIATERKRGDVALARWLWLRDQRSIEPERLVFVDETGTATNMAPLYGWGARGERLIGTAPHGRWRRTTFVGGLTLTGFVAPMVIEQAMNRAIFETWIEQALVPGLPEGAIVVMDNLAAHKGGRVAELIEAAGGEVLYLPPYSPDLNPIEQAFAKLKHWLRHAARRTTETLWDEIGAILSRFASQDCANFFRNSGYRSV